MTSSSPTITQRSAPGCAESLLYAIEPFSMTPQKALVTLGPKVESESSGTVGLVERSPAIQRNGSSHWRFVLRARRARC